QGTGYSMKFPETMNTPLNDPEAAAFLDAFNRGNRDDQPRTAEGSVLQAFTLMNSRFLDSFLQVEGETASPLLASSIGKSNAEVIETLFLTILSRRPTAAETGTALRLLESRPRVEALQDLAWSLYNKVDFVFNY